MKNEWMYCYSMNSKKWKIQEFTFIRAVCAIWIIIYHFSCYTHSPLSTLHYNANAQWGSPIVTVFFILSGTVLRYNNKTITSLGLFYYKRWKSVFPAFYLAFLFLFIQNVFAFGDLFYLGEPWKLIFTLIGIDGYVNIPNYYIIGEWFLGAIIILYLLYPAVSYTRNRNKIMATGIVLFLYIICIFTDFVPMYKFREIPVCLLEMYLGILFADNREKILNNTIVKYAALIVSLLLIFIPVQWPMVLVMCELPATMLGCSLFIVLYAVGATVMKNRVVNLIVFEIGSLSYPIFLLQHVIIQKMINYQNPYSLLGGIIVLLVTIVLTIIFAKTLSIVTDAVIGSRLYLKIENSIINKTK